jgi:hypothetical protein
MSDYGSVEGVAAIASTWTRGGEFFDADLVYNVSPTNPPLATVEAWLETMSAYMNAALMDAYFEIPLTDDFHVSFVAVDQQVNMLVADLVAARNQQGRFFLQTAEVSRDITNWTKIQKELQDWVKSNVETFLAEGVPQITTNPIRAGQTAVILQDDEFNP